MTIEELRKKDINELKCIAYDTLLQLEGLQQSSKIINQLIAEKSQQPDFKDGKPLVEEKKDVKPETKPTK